MRTAAVHGWSLDSLTDKFTLNGKDVGLYRKVYRDGFNVMRINDIEGRELERASFAGDGSLVHYQKSPNHEVLKELFGF